MHTAAALVSGHAYNIAAKRIASAWAELPLRVLCVWPVFTTADEAAASSDSFGEWAESAAAGRVWLLAVAVLLSCRVRTCGSVCGCRGHRILFVSDACTFL